MAVLYTVLLFHHAKDDDIPLTVLGDVLASFLKVPDDRTIGLNLLNEKTLKRDPSLWGVQKTRQWKMRPRRWLRTASWKRWLSSFLL
jgi:hypothetical protein